VSKIPLREQIEGLEAEFDRRSRDYPIMMAIGDLSLEAANFRQARLAAAINTLCWLDRHKDDVRAWVAHIVPELAAEGRSADVLDDLPAELEPSRAEFGEGK
jgi:hypothetical protein